MEMSIKHLALYTVFLFVFAGGITLAFAPPPEDVAPLWERIWKVEEPVTVDGTILVTTGAGAPIDVTLDEPIDVTLDEPIEVYNPSNIELVCEKTYSSVSFKRIHLTNITKYKYLYVYYAETTDPLDDDIDCRIYYELDEGNYHFIADTLYGDILGESPAKIEVASTVIEIWIKYDGIGTSFDHPVYVAVYGSTK